MRWMLALDTCGAAGSVALVELASDLAAGEPGYRVAAERVLPGRETQEQLMLAIGGVLAAAGLRASDLDVLGVVTGPGSFTGVRIGLAAVKGLAEALGLPVVAVSRLAVLAGSVVADCSHSADPNPSRNGADGFVAAWLEAGRGDVFVGRYKGGLMLSERMLTGADALSQRVPGEAVAVMEASLAERVPDAVVVSAVGVREALPLLVERARVGAFADVALLDANYLRVPDAELARLRALAAL